MTTRATARRAPRPRILILDGAMGTMVQQHKLDEARVRGERFPRASGRAAEQHRPAGAHTPRDHFRDPSRVSRGRRRHHRDEHVRGDSDRAGRLQSRVARLRPERRRRTARLAGRRRVVEPHARSSAVRRRRDRPDQPHALDLARRQQSRRFAPRRSRASATPIASRCAG